VMIVFFVLIGGLIHARAEAQEKALGRLATQFADRIRTLPTILANHALDHEHDKLELRMRAYAQATMNTLKVAFLNAGIIDFFSSLAIAILAVFLGLGHLGLIHFPGFSGLQLSQSLFILMMAPDYFAPFRRYAEQYHAKAEGMAAADALDWLFVRDRGDSAQPHLDQVAAIRNRVAKALHAPFPPAGLIAVVGPSGSGKSTFLRALAGVEQDVAVGSPARSIAWVSSDVYVPAGSLAGAIGWNRPQIAASEIDAAAGATGLLDDPFLPDGLSTVLAEGGENLSGGQRMRLAVARALLSEGVIVADEPTAKLDPTTANLVRDALLFAARSRPVIVATHDMTLAGGARRTVDFGVKAEARAAA